MKELIEQIAKALVDHPEQVSVQPIEGEQMIVFELRVAQSDIGKVIGKEGRTAASIRTILSAAGMKLKKRFTLKFLEFALPSRLIREGIPCCPAQNVVQKICAVPIFSSTIGPYSCSSLFPSDVAIATPASICSVSVKLSDLSRLSESTLP